MKKCLTVLLALSLAFTLAACGKEEPVAADPEITTIEGTAEIAANEITLNESSSAESTSIEGTTAEGMTDEVPTDTAGIIAYYNAALGATAMRRVSYRRTMTKITARAALGLLNEQNMQDDPGVQNLGNVDETKNEPSDLVALRGEWVREAGSSVSSDTVMLTIKLKNRDLDPGDTSFDPRPGTNGYVSTVGKATAEQIVIDSAMTLAGGILSRVDVTKTAFGLEGGVYTITVNVQTRKIERVSFSVTQSAQGEAKCRVSVIPVSVTAGTTMRWDNTGVYLPA